jgi:MFS family permease
MRVRVPAIVVPAGRLRRSMRASMVEGMLAEVVGALAGGTVLTAWAMHLGASAFELALLAALPNLSQLVRLPGAWLVERLRARRLAIPAIVLSRLVLTALVVLPWLSLSPAAQRGVLLTVAAVSSVASIVGNCGWTVWMADLVPARLRGRYFGRRTAAATTANMTSVLLASLAIDAARARGHEAAVLSLLALVAVAAGAATWALLARQHDPAPQRGVHQDPSWRAALQPLVDGAARPLLAFNLLWNAALGVAAAFFTLFMLGPLGLGYSWVALHGLVLASMRVVTAPTWGRVLDRHGARAVLVACTAGLALAPLPWLLLARGNLWLLCVDPIWVGTFTAGYSLATFDLPLRVAPRRGRAYYLAAFAMAGGVGFALAAALGGAWVGQQDASTMRTLFFASAVARAGAAALALRIVVPRGKNAL